MFKLTSCDELIFLRQEWGIKVRITFILTLSSLQSSCEHLQELISNLNYSLLSLPQIVMDWTKYVELSVVRGNQIMTYMATILGRNKPLSTRQLKDHY